DIGIDVAAGNRVLRAVEDAGGQRTIQLCNTNQLRPVSTFRIMGNLARPLAGFIRDFAAFIRGGWPNQLESRAMDTDRRRMIQIVSHGPACLDGVVAAASVARFYSGEKVHAALAANQDSDRTLAAIRPRNEGGPDELWITDLSWTSTATG